ncbi:MAG: class I SAM-dependent rRNA methyltransferase [Lachnospiraceae bacterium]|nr:class I SAM-dependent rRNA methyltransferase [Lachnospiraceae bacterium]
MPTIVTLKKGEGRTIKAGGAWIFDNEVQSIAGHFSNGEVVLVKDFDGYPMGKGFINQNSKIRVRMLTRDIEQEIDDAFLKMRLTNAWEYRKTVMAGGNTGELPNIGNTKRPDLNCCRIVFGEADFLPGLTVDKYGDVLVVECLALGMEAFKEQIVQLLVEILKEDDIEIRLVYERSDAREREKEGLVKFKGVLYSKEESLKERIGINDFGKEKESPVPAVEIVENGVHYIVDVVSGQKTGFFLDQKYNRQAMHRICKGKKVLDCFTHMGTFALNAGLAGAREVTGLDISEFAITQATHNAERNHLQDVVKFRTANVLDELPKLYEAGERYDVVILDPPAFTKSKDATKNAIKGYREVNMKGLKLVQDGGYLATCSCSHFMTQELFTTMMHQAAKAVHKRLRQVEFRTQAPDHPILWNSAPGTEESYYLKFFIFQVVDER